MECFRSQEFPYYVSRNGGRRVFTSYLFDPIYSIYRGTRNPFYSSNFSEDLLQKFMIIEVKNLRLLRQTSAKQNNFLEGVYAYLFDELALPNYDLDTRNFLFSLITFRCSQARMFNSSTKVDEHFIGYPSSPLLSHLLYTLLELILLPSNSSKSPFMSYNLLDEGAYRLERELRFASIGPHLERVRVVLKAQDFERLFRSFDALLAALGTRGVYDLLGLRHTAASLELMPPPRALRSFLRPNRPPAPLSVGARALAKHVHRDQCAGWWGDPGDGERRESRGPPATQNDRALRVLARVLDGARWINIHLLPQSLPTLEVRHADGYGARWLLLKTDQHEHSGVDERATDAPRWKASDGNVYSIVFRGFLEPQFAGGHEVHWRH